jgi:uncharacterized protein YjbI with pentapeptide repeats
MIKLNNNINLGENFYNNIIIKFTGDNMLNNKIKGCIVFAILIFLTIGAVNAVDVADDSASQADTVSAQSDSGITTTASAGDKNQITKNSDSKGLKTASDSGFDFSTLNFSSLNLSGVNGSNFNFTGLNTSGLDLSSLNLSTLNFSSGNSSSFNMSNFNTSSLNLSSLNLSSLNLSTLNFSGMNTSGLNFSDMNSSNLDLSSLNLSDLNLSSLNLSDLDFSSMFNSTNSSNFNFSGLNTSSLSSLNLSGLDLSSLDLSSLNLSSLFSSMSNNTNDTDDMDVTIDTPITDDTIINNDTDDISDNPIVISPQKEKQVPPKNPQKTYQTKTVQKQPAKTHTIKRASDNKVVSQGNALTLEGLNKIFDTQFTNGQLLVYIDGELVFNSTTTDDLSKIIFEIIEKYLGEHNIKVEFTDANNNTNSYDQKIIIE